MASGVLQTVDGLSQLSSPYVGVSLTVGASGSKSQSGTSSSTAVGTRINAQSLTLEAGHDIRLQGAQIKVTKDFLADAKHDLVIESAQSTSTSSSSSRNWNASFGIEATIVGSSPGGLVVSGGYGQSKAGSYSIMQLNTHMDVGGKATFKAGHDATFAGAVVKAGVIDTDVKGNLTVMSRQDLAHGDSSSMNASGSLHIGPVPSVSLSLGGSSGTSDVAWVSEQTGLYSKGAITIHAKGDMTVAGAVIASESHQGSITAKTLTVTDILDHDTASSVSGQVGVSTPGAPGAIPGVTVSGSYAGHDIEQTTRGTIGEGIALTVTDKKNSTPEDKINRDTTQAQVITKNQSAGVQVYASTNAVKEISTGFRGIRNNFQNYGKNFENVPQNIKKGIDQAIAAGDLIGNTINEIANGLVNTLKEKGQLTPAESKKQTAILDKLKTDPAYLKILEGCAVGTIECEYTSGQAATAISIYATAGSGSGAAAVAGAAFAAALGTLADASTNGKLDGLINQTQSLPDGSKLSITGGGATATVTLVLESSDKSQQTTLILSNAPSGYVLTDVQVTVGGETSALTQRQLTGLLDATQDALNQHGIFVVTNQIKNDSNAQEGLTKTPTGAVIDTKIRDQMEDRGWTVQDVDEKIKAGPVGTSTDNRSPGKTPDGQGRNDTATVYGKPGDYVVVNDRTKEIVQVSDKTRPWTDDGRIKWW